jgi:thioesterase domain-containing protein
VEPDSRSKSIEALAPIWERVLQRSPISAEDNFFDLGGDPSSAGRLLAEIEQKCGRELPRFIIYHAPTLSALGALLEQPSLPRFPTLIPLNSSAGWPPVFIAPGMGGNPLDYFPLVRHIRSQHPIFALQARGLDGTEEPFVRIEDTAQYYIDAIKLLQPHGPYLLVGNSLGGLVALEMAQRLTANGEKVALVAMLESYPHFRFLSFGQRLRLLIRLAKYHVSTALRLPMREAFSYFVRRAKRRLYIPGDDSGGSPPPDGVALSPATQRLRDCDHLALTRYRPRFYDGRIKFVRSAVSVHFPDDPTAVWAGLVRELDVETVPGDHYGIITTHFESLAAVLSRYLREASC